MSGTILRKLKTIEQRAVTNYRCCFKEFNKGILSSIVYLLELCAGVSLFVVFGIWAGETAVTGTYVLQFINSGMKLFSMIGFIKFLFSESLKSILHDNRVNFEKIINMLVLHLLIFTLYIDFSSIPRIIVSQTYLLLIIFLFKLFFISPQEASIQRKSLKFERKEMFDGRLTKTTAYHEAGHIAVTLLLNKIVYGSYILANGNGNVRHSGVIATNVTSDFIFEKQASDLICISYAGKLSERLFIEEEDRILGSDMDITIATRALYKLSKHGCGKLAMLDMLELRSIRPTELDLAKEIGACSALAKKYEEYTTHLLESHKELVEMLADALWKKKHLSQKQIEKIYKKYKEGENNGCKNHT